MDATLLVELLTEELPPKSLRVLSEAFCSALFFDLQKSGFLAEQSTSAFFGTPRRLAAQISQVRERSPDAERELQGPPVKASRDAVAGFARKCGVAPESLGKRATSKGEIFVARVRIAGSALDAVLAEKVAAALKSLPAQKLMRWGQGTEQFVRPVHNLVMMHGARVVPGAVLGVSASGTTRGHRFMAAHSIALKSADEYEARLREDGRVIADFAARRAEAERQLREEAARQRADLGDCAALLDEVTALVEFPQVYAGAFDAAYLAVPPECLVLTMRQHQRYFPLFDAAGALLPKFLIVSNLRAGDPRHIVRGNERVVRPRLEDARFFFEQDRKTRLETRVPQLANVVYHSKLGSQLERVERLQILAGGIARRLGADAARAERAAWLCKADLLTGMVAEFPELQGVMGRYYARHDGEAPEIADAIEAHYRPRHASDGLPEGPLACAVALADKLDTLVGIFGAGAAPTGDKDPFALRRHALGVLRILAERNLALSLPELIAEAQSRFKSGTVPGWVCTEVYNFVLERLRHHLREGGHGPNEIEAVLSQLPERIDLVPARLHAVSQFAKLPEAKALAAANKRIRNILRQANFSLDGAAKPGLLKEAAEKDLYREIVESRGVVEAKFGAREYQDALFALARLRPHVDKFFDKVLVNDKDKDVRENRLRILGELDHLMNRVADISQLAIEK